MTCGVMVNYACTAACRHCLYACDPTWTCGYMNESVMREACQTLKKYGCRSIHVGGGEPFMDFEGLLTFAQIAGSAGISIEYVETNAYWATDEADVINKLRALQKVGVDALCISGDDYHAEFIDDALPLKLARICRSVGFGHFLWQTRLERLRFNGRAITLQEDFPRRPAKDLINFHPDGCKNLTSLNHFHIDLHGRYIPPGCTGIVLGLDEVLDDSLAKNPDKYPAFGALYSGGLAALFALAKERGFAEDPAGYPAPCTLCFHLRAFLSSSCDELDEEHYAHAVKIF